MPAHIQQQSYGEVPWYRRLTDAIRPPSAVPSHRTPMSGPQKRMLIMTAAIVVPATLIWVAVGYLAGAPQRAKAAFEDGMRIIATHDFAGAVQRFSDSIAIRESADAYMERGNAYENLQQTDRALADWSKALNLNPGLAAAYTARATHYRLAGDFAKALPDLEQSIQIDPSVDGYFQRGQVYAALGDYQKAIEDYDRSILERREAPYVYLARSIAKRALGDDKGYEEDQQRAARLQGIH